MKTSITMTGNKMFVARDQQGNETLIDMREEEKKQGPSPMEMLLSALGACVGVDIAIVLEKRKKTISRFTIDVEGARREEHPMGFTAIHCTYRITSLDVEEAELHKTAKMALEKYCSVARSLNATITFSAVVEK